MNHGNPLDDLVAHMDELEGLFTGSNNDPGCTLEVGLPSWLEQLLKRMSKNDVGLGDAWDMSRMWMRNTIKYAYIFGNKVVINLNFPIAFKCVKKSPLPYDEVPCSGVCKPEEKQFDIKLEIPVNTVGTDAWKDGVKECMGKHMFDEDQFKCILALIQDIGLMGWGHIDKDDWESMTEDEQVEFITPVLDELLKWMEEEFYPLLWKGIAVASKIRCKCKRGDSGGRGGSGSNDFMFSLYSPQMKNKLGKGMGLMDGKTVLVPSTLQAEIDRIAERLGVYPNLSGVRDLLTNRRIP